MGEDPDPSTDESADDETQRPSGETASAGIVSEGSDSDGTGGEEPANAAADEDPTDADEDPTDADSDLDDADAEGNETGDADAEGDDADEADTDVDAGADPNTSDAAHADQAFDEQLAQARENNPPLDREAAVEPDTDPYGSADDADIAADAAANAATGTADTADDEDLFDGPESDEEMPLAVHIEEMMKRLGVVFLFAGVATAIAFPSASDLINYLWSYHIPAPVENRPRLYGPLELVLTRLKVAGISGVIVGLPVFVYESYLFMRPGLYRTERRYYLAAVPTSLILGAVGMLFAHFLVLPAIFRYFTSYTTGVAVVAYGLAETFNLIVMLISFMAVVFQIPLFIMLAIMMGLVTREWLEDKRLVFWGTFFGIAFLFSPDPTGMAPIIVTLTMISLYEGTLALLRWTGN